MTKSKDAKPDHEQVQKLLKEVEKRFGQPLHSPSDFTKLCYSVEEHMDQSLSLSTVKRLWGYVECEYVPRISTLSLLSRYVGYRDWFDFVEHLNSPIISESGFMGGSSILADDLTAGDEVIFTWAPDRRCRALYIGGNCFRVLESHGSKIETDDTFHATLLAVGLPLYATNIVKSCGETHNFYVAGKQKGLSSLLLSKKGETGYKPVK